MQYVTHRAVAGGVAAATQDQALSALLVLYREVLGIDLPWLDKVTRAERPQRLPVVLTRDEVHAVLGKVQPLWGRINNERSGCKGDTEIQRLYAGARGARSNQAPGIPHKQGKRASPHRTIV